jgi:hypothetical protein
MNQNVVSNKPFKISAEPPGAIILLKKKSVLHWMASEVKYEWMLND